MGYCADVMKLMHFVLGFALVAVVNGCGTTTGLSPKTAHSGFDNARTVDISPHGTISSGNSAGIGIGAQWNEAHKDQAILIFVVYLTYTGITGAELNIDGEKIALTPTATVTDMASDVTGMKSSAKGFVTKLDTVERIVRSKRTWVRLHTPTGTMESAVIDGAKDSKAYHALKRFMNDVKPVKT